eukprot:358401-Chlamydomonas_euryale.AAC.1
MVSLSDAISASVMPPRSTGRSAPATWMLIRLPAVRNGTGTYATAVEGRSMLHALLWVLCCLRFASHTVRRLKGHLPGRDRKREDSLETGHRPHSSQAIPVTNHRQHRSYRPHSSQAIPATQVTGQRTKGTQGKTTSCNADKDGDLKQPAAACNQQQKSSW